MSARICARLTLMPFLLTSVWAHGQPSGNKAAGEIRLELKMEVATTNEDGSPQALRFTLANVGERAVMLPLPAIDCSGDAGRIHVLSKVVSGSPDEGGVGHGCASWTEGGVRPILERIKKEWLHLEPGEFLAFTGDGRSIIDKSNGNLEYEFWAEYEPPKLRDEERKEAISAGLLFPTEPVTSGHLTFYERWPSD